MHTIVYTAEAKHQIQKRDHRVQIQIKKDIERIASDPRIGKRLSGDLSGFISCASGDYRIIYKVSQHEVLVMIMTAGHRKDVYEKAARNSREQNGRFAGAWAGKIMGIEAKSANIYAVPWNVF